MQYVTYARVASVCDSRADVIASIAASSSRSDGIPGARIYGSLAGVLSRYQDLVATSLCS